MNLYFLGTSAAIASPERDNTSLYLKTSKTGFLIDCPGAIVHKITKIKVNFKSIDKIIITHIHPDHIYGLPSLIHSQYKLKNKIKIYGTGPTIEFIKHLIDIYNLNNVNKYPILDFSIIPLSGSKIIYEDDEISIISYPVKHTVESIGLKFILKNAKVGIGYSGDTGPCEDVVRENMKIDYLIHDCLCPSRYSYFFPSLDEEHTSAFSLGKIAKEINTEHLIPIHFSTEVSYSIDEIINEIRMNYKGKIIIPNDFDILELK